MTLHSTVTLNHLQDAHDVTALLRSLGRPRVEGLYVHVPFCFHKCHYCDFYSIVDSADRQGSFTRRLVEEMRAVGAEVSGSVRTVFVGGGTPTLLSAEAWSQLFQGLRAAFDLADLQEFTVEANPETVDEQLLQVLAAGGVNRLSIGAQSFDPGHLKTLERWHDPASVERAVAAARLTGFDDINLDLIFAIPGQDLEAVRRDLDRALELEPTHLSCYSLMYEPNTPLMQKLRQGRVERCDIDREAAMLELVMDHLAAAGFGQYEISNYARPGRACRHNQLYWENGNYLALGPSAAGHVDAVRWKNVAHLGRYLASSGAAPIEETEQLDPDASLGEQLMLRLRLVAGVEWTWLEPRLDLRRRRQIDRHVQAGLLERTSTNLRLTRRGLMLADTVLAELL